MEQRALERAETGSGITRAGRWLSENLGMGSFAGGQRDRAEYMRSQGISSGAIKAELDRLRADEDRTNREERVRERMEGMDPEALALLRQMDDPTGTAWSDYRAQPAGEAGITFDPDTGRALDPSGDPFDPSVEDDYEYGNLAQIEAMRERGQLSEEQYLAAIQDQEEGYARLPPEHLAQRENPWAVDEMDVGITDDNGLGSADAVLGATGSRQERALAAQALWGRTETGAEEELRKYQLARAQGARDDAKSRLFADVAGAIAGSGGVPGGIAMGLKDAIYGQIEQGDLARDYEGLPITAAAARSRYNTYAEQNQALQDIFRAASSRGDIDATVADLLCCQSPYWLPL